MRKFLLLIILSVVGLQAVAQTKDSVAAASKSRAHLRLSLFTHSQGQFQFGGRLVTTNPGMNFGLNYDRKTWGFMMFKAADLKDSHTDFNFMLAAFNKTFKIGKKLTVMPALGVLFEQSRTFADHGSDAAFILISNYKLSKKLSLEYTTLFGNFIVTPEEKDWVNRLRLTYTKDHLDVIASGWHNNSVFDEVSYVTYSLGVFYSRMKISDHFLWQAGVTCLRMPYTSDEKVDPTTNGLYFTVALQFVN